MPGDCAIHPVSSAPGKTVWCSSTGGGAAAGERGDCVVSGGFGSWLPWILLLDDFDKQLLRDQIYYLFYIIYFDINLSLLIYK